jgi:stearoyl-CoA desaturase (delta-9 desaturase)
VLWEGVELYRAACKDQSIMDKFGHGTPDDWIEHKLYTPHFGKGIILMLASTCCCSARRAVVWAVQMVWIPFWAAGVINGLGHWWGYRNFENEDASTNIFPWGIIVGGEELHNNHHTFGTSAKLSYKWYEFDIGWMYIRMLEICHLAKVRRRSAPRLARDASRPQLDLEHPGHYLQPLRHCRTLCPRVERGVSQRAGTGQPARYGRSACKMKIWLKQDAKDTPECDKAQLELLLQHSPTLTTVYTMRQELCRLWSALADAGAAAARIAGLVRTGRAIRHCCAGALCVQSAHDCRGLTGHAREKTEADWRFFYGAVLNDYSVMLWFQYACLM